MGEQTPRFVGLETGTENHLFVEEHWRRVK